VLGLKWSDVDLSGGRIVVPAHLTVNSTAATVSLQPETLATLQAITRDRESVFACSRRTYFAVLEKLLELTDAAASQLSISSPKARGGAE
jgi:hypothetical protein